MTRLLTLVLLGITTFAAISCGDVSKSDNKTDKLSDNTYRGVIPCADCAGILYELSLSGDQSYSASSTYIGESNRPFIKQGSWNVQDDTLLVLRDSSEAKRVLAIEDSTLTMLNADHEYITGSLADHYVLGKEPVRSDSSDTRWTNLRKAGIDFRASGDKPSWNIKVDFDSAMTFSLKDGDSVEVSTPQMKRDTTSKARVLAAQTAEGSLRVDIYPTGCIDNKTGKVFSHGVSVKTNDETYRGCGSIINKQYRLNGFWTLHSLRGTDMKADSLRKMPAINIDVAKERVSGNSGCNMFSGSMTQQGDSLSFEKIASTKMACQGSMEFENEFLTTLSQVDSYKVKDGELMLFKNNEPLIVFIRTK